LFVLKMKNYCDHRKNTIMTEEWDYSNSPIEENAEEVDLDTAYRMRMPVQPLPVSRTEESSSLSSEEGDSDELEWSDDEGAVGGVDANAMQKIASSNKSGKVKELREKMEKMRKKQLKNFDNYALKKTTREKARDTERQFINTTRTNSKATGYWRTQPGDWKQTTMESSTAAELVHPVWNISQKFRTKPKKDETEKERDVKYVDFSKGRTTVDIQAVRESLWINLDISQVHSLISLSREIKGTVVTISKKKIETLHKYYFENIDQEMTVEEILGKWYKKVALFSGSLASSFVSLSHWINNDWLSPEGFFNLPSNLTFPELFLSGSYRDLPKEGRDRIVKLLRIYIDNYAVVMTANLVNRGLMTDPTAKTPKTFETPVFPMSVYRLVSEMSRNCSSDIPIGRLVGYFDGKSVICGDVLEMKRLVDTDDVGVPDSFILLMKTLTPDFFVFDIPEELEKGEILEAVVEPVTIEKPQSDTYKILLDLLDKDKSSARRKKDSEIRQLCDNCNRKMGNSNWITGEYMDGHGSIQKFCSRACFDTASIKIHSDEKPVHEIREKDPLYSDEITKQIEEEFDAYYDVAVDDKFDTLAKRKEWMKRSILIGERAERNSEVVRGVSNVKTLEIMGRVKILNDVMIGKSTIADTIMKNERVIAQKAIERELAKVSVFKNNEIKDWLRDRKLSTNGKRPELLERVQNHINGFVDSGEIDEQEEPDDLDEDDLEDLFGNKDKEEVDDEGKDEGEGSAYGNEDEDDIDFDDMDLFG
jgi:hypothetical protein